MIVNEKNLLEIECEGSLYKLATMNPDEFPELPKIEVEDQVFEAAEDEENVLEFLKYYMTPEEIIEAEAELLARELTRS